VTTSVHLLGTFFQTFLDSQHTLFTYFQSPSKTFSTSRSTSTPTAFEVITVNVLYKLLTYLLTAASGLTCVGVF